MQEISLFETILNTNIINFIIVISTLVFIFKKAHLGDIIAKTAEEIKLSVEKSSTDTQNAISQYKSTKKSVKDVPELEKAILSQAKINAEILKERIGQKTELQQQEIRSSLDRIFDTQAKKFKNLTLEDVYRASIDLAEEEVIKRLDKNVHKKLINSSIDELDKIEGNLS